MQAIIENGICVGKASTSPGITLAGETISLPDGYGVGDLYADGVWTKGTPPVYVPQSVSMRQAELELYDSGLLDDVEALVATLPRAYQIEWKRASTVDRTNPLVEVVRNQQGLTSEDIDNLFIRAAAR